MGNFVGVCISFWLYSAIRRFSLTEESTLRVISTAKGWKGSLSTVDNAMAVYVFVPSSGKKRREIQEWHLWETYMHYTHPLYYCFLCVYWSFQATGGFLFKDTIVWGQAGFIRVQLWASNVKCICSSQEVFSVFVHAEIFYLQGVFCLH